MSEVRTNSILRPADDKLLLRKEGCVLQTITEATYSSVYENTSNNSEYDLPGDLGNGNAKLHLYFLIVNYCLRQLFIVDIMRLGDKIILRLFIK